MIVHTTRDVTGKVRIQAFREMSKKFSHFQK